jgi:hypothetical protein
MFYRIYCQRRFILAAAHISSGSTFDSAVEEEKGSIGFETDSDDFATASSASSASSAQDMPPPSVSALPVQIVIPPAAVVVATAGPGWHEFDPDPYYTSEAYLLKQYDLQLQDAGYDTDERKDILSNVGLDDHESSDNNDDDYEYFNNTFNRLDFEDAQSRRE